MPKALTFLAIYFPMSWLFAIIAETRKDFGLFGSLHLMDLRSKNFGCLPLHDTSRVQ